jgi:hypothetical protein
MKRVLAERPLQWRRNNGFMARVDRAMARPITGARGRWLRPHAEIVEHGSHGRRRIKPASPSAATSSRVNFIANVALGPKHPWGHATRISSIGGKIGTHGKFVDAIAHLVAEFLPNLVIEQARARVCCDYETTARTHSTVAFAF